MQITLKQSEITAAIGLYLSSVLGVSGVNAESLAVTYKQGRSDKNGMTAELDIDAPRYERKAVEAEQPAKQQVSGETSAPVEATSALNVEPQEPAPVEVAVDPVPAFEGERRAEDRVALVEAEPVLEAPVDLPFEPTPLTESVEDEVAAALAEDAAAEEAEVEVPVETDTAAAKLFG